MDDNITVLLATGDNILEPVVADMVDAKIVGMALKQDQILDMVEDLFPKVTILADYMDPGMQLATSLSHHYSRTRVIYIITSDEDKKIKENLVSLEIYDFLPHTFRKSELHQMIRQPRGLHHLVGEGLQLEKLVGRPPKIRKQGGGGTKPNSETASYENIPVEAQQNELNKACGTDRTSSNLFGRIIHGFRNSYKRNSLDQCSSEQEQNGFKTNNYGSFTPGTTSPRCPNPKSPNLDQEHLNTRTSGQIVNTPLYEETQNVKNLESDTVQKDKSISIKVVKQQIVTFWSAKPGIGKTFLAVNTAISLARSGIRVVLVDGDILNLSVGVYLNLMDEKKTLEKALKFEHINDIEQCLIFHPKFPSLAVLSGSDHCRPESYCSVTEENVHKMLEYLKTKFDVIIFDTASDIQTVTTFVGLHQATKVILLTNQDYAQVFATKRMFSLLNRLNISQDKFFLLLNGELENSKLTRSMVESMLGLRINLVMPFLPLPVVNSIFDSNPLVLQTNNETLLMRKRIQSLAEEIFPVSVEDKVSLTNSLAKILGKRGSMSYG